MAVANTPGPGNPISLVDIHRIFGKGNEPASPGWELDNYQGVEYWDSTYPFNKGRFSANTLDLEDFYSKCAQDPVIPGSIFFGTPNATAATFFVPPFRNFFRIEVWGAGGGAGGASKAGYYNGTAGQGSSVTSGPIISNPNIVAIAGGGGAGTGGYRYGSQNGAGGGGGVVGTTIYPGGVQVLSQNGESGFSGDAVNGFGARGGNAPFGGAGGARGGYNTSNYNGSNSGWDGNIPGGGGGSGGSSEFRSKDVSRSAGGSGGGGAYISYTFNRFNITVGSRLFYSVGAGGVGGAGPISQGNGGRGASGGVRFSWS